MSRRRPQVETGTAGAAQEGSGSAGVVLASKKQKHDCRHAGCKYGHRSKQEVLLHERCVYHTASGTDENARCAPTADMECLALQGGDRVGHNLQAAQESLLECRWYHCDEVFR